MLSRRSLCGLGQRGQGSAQRSGADARTPPTPLTRSSLHLLFLSPRSRARPRPLLILLPLLRRPAPRASLLPPRVCCAGQDQALDRAQEGFVLCRRQGDVALGGSLSARDVRPLTLQPAQHRAAVQGDLDHGREREAVAQHAQGRCGRLGVRRPEGGVAAHTRRLGG